MRPTMRLGSGILYMKVGTHAQETLDDIIARKTKEIEDAGFALWGYGGNTCHPLTMVQPFADDYHRRNGAIYLCMEPMNSRHFAEQIRARQYSIDGIKWEDIPAAINVIGSRYALVIRDLRREDFDLALSHTKVAVGKSTGLRGDRYVSGRVDKACLEVTQEPLAGVGDEQRIRIGLLAEVVDPYAVFVKN